MIDWVLNREKGLVYDSVSFMKIIEKLKDMSGCLFVILFFVAIFIIIRLTAVIPFSALEAWPEAEKIAKEKYPGAQLTSVEANTYTTETRIVGERKTTYGIEYTYETIKHKNDRPLHDDGTAEEWFFSFYSPAEKLDINVTVEKRRVTKKLSASIHKKKIGLSRADRIGRSEEEIQEKNRELQEKRESAIFDSKDWKIDSTEAIEIANPEGSKDFHPYRISLGGNGWKIDYNIPSPTGEIEKHTIWIDAISGEISQKD